MEHEFRVGDGGTNLKGSEDYHKWLTESGLKTIHYLVVPFEKAFVDYQAARAALPKVIHPATGIHKDLEGNEFFRMVYTLPGKVSIASSLFVQGSEAFMRVAGKVSIIFIAFFCLRLIHMCTSMAENPNSLGDNQPPLLGRVQGRGPPSVHCRPHQATSSGKV